MTAQVMASGPRHSAGRDSRFRGDVEGLRAVAIGLVLLYHAGLAFVPGGFVGVDVFFVISGFLITTQLVSEVDRTGTVSLPKFYARRAKRLLPAAAIVLATTVVLVRLYVPRTRWEEIGGDIVGSALYFVNWRLADRSVDYLAEDSEASPVQHFWSLAVEEQYYLVWPLLILLAAGAARLIRSGVRPALWLGLAAVAIPSFGWALLETARAPERAFFITTTRMWELAIGAAVALGAAAFTRLPRWWAVPIGWAGLVAIASSGLWYDTGTPWPGHAALLPTLGTAAVIAAGFAAARGGPGWLLGTAPFRWVGGLSYSLYLWHWPLLAVAAVHWGELSAPAGLALTAFSVLPAWLTYKLVENPLRHSPAISRSPRLALSLGANFTLVGVVAGLALLVSFSTALPDRGQVPPDQQALGAAVLAEQPRDDPAGAPVDTVEWMTPDPLEATEDVPDIYAEGCQQGFEEAEVLSCEYGDSGSDMTVVVAGDSKIVQWLPALQPLADANGWRLVTYTKSNCGFHAATTMVEDSPYDTCLEWNRALLDILLADPPDYVLTSQRAAHGVGVDGESSVDAMITGLRSVWTQLTAVGTEVVVIADNPGPGFNVYECVEEHRDELSQCTYDRELYESDSAAPTQWQAVAGESGVHFVDLFDAICPTQPCAPVIGNVLVYRQGSHITATYIETLTPRLAAELSDVGIPAELGATGQLGGR
jgi:peptidoglycan/LPS O-acetylase OafA/YrhL